MTAPRDPGELPPREARRRLRAALAPETPADPVAAIARVLGFVHDDLAALIARLGDFAAEPVDQPSARAGARRVGAKLTGLAATLEGLDQAAWAAAAHRVRRSGGYQGWRTTCRKVAASPASLSAMWVVAERLAEAGLELAACDDAAPHVRVQARAQAAVQRLLGAADAWNQAVEKWTP
jgi:hypothetical protein